jgi:acyl-CoA synthetase (AMP-forming)/AMP-acid ligase II
LGEESGAFFSKFTGSHGKVKTDATKKTSDIFVLPYSSGTTGLAKGVQLSHKNVVSNIMQISGHPEHNTGVSNSDVCIGILPSFHIYGMTLVLSAPIRLGATTVFLPKFDPETFLTALSKYKVTYAALVPPIISFLANHPIVSKFDLSSLKRIMSGAAPLDANTQLALEKRLPGVTVNQGYGLTESSPVTHFLDPREKAPGSVGKLAPSTRARILHRDTGLPMPPGKENVGELYISGPQVMQGYLNNAKATASTVITMDGDRWLASGDVAWADEKGYTYLVDRLQVAPAELEGELIQHPQIAGAAVVGAPDERAGEVPVAFIARRPVAPGTPLLDEAGVLAFMNGKLADYKTLHSVFFVDAIPVSATGKILRRVLRDMLPKLLAEKSAANVKK